MFVSPVVAPRSGGIGGSMSRMVVMCVVMPRMSVARQHRRSACVAGRVLPEFSKAFRTAKQERLAGMIRPVRRVRFDCHPTDGVLQFTGDLVLDHRSFLVHLVISPRVDSC